MSEANSEPGYVRPNELILLYHDGRSTYLTPFRPGGRFECHHGSIRYPERVRWGEALRTNRGVPLAVLRPNHREIMTMIKRRTTVVYPKEAGRIVLELGVRSGGVYAECGSGSGAMTALLAALVGPDGHVHSFDRDPDHQAQARRNVERLGLADRVTFYLADPGREGFADLRDLDGIFVDVPEPWHLVAPAAVALGGGAPWVSLSPTVDQVARTEVALFDHGFVLRRMSETLERNWKLFVGRTRPDDRMVGHTAFLLTARRVLDPEFPRTERRR